MATISVSNTIRFSTGGDVSEGQNAIAGDVIALTLLSGYTPSVYSTANAVVSGFSVSNGSSANSTTTCNITLTNTGTWSVVIHQPYGNKYYTISGTVSATSGSTDYGLAIFGPEGQVWLDTSDQTWFHTANVAVPADTDVVQDVGSSSVGFNKIALINIINTAPDNQEGYAPVVSFSTVSGQTRVTASNNSNSNKNQASNILVADSDMTAPTTGQVGYVEITPTVYNEAWSANIGDIRSPDPYVSRTFTMPSGIFSIKVKLRQYPGVDYGASHRAYFKLRKVSGSSQGQKWTEGADSQFPSLDYIQTTSAAISVTAGASYRLEGYAPQYFNTYLGQLAATCMGNVTIIDNVTGSTIADWQCWYRWHGV
jgi:hypothetical protein